MAKIDKPRYSNNGRKRPEIDLESEQAKTPPAEPIGLDENIVQDKPEKAGSALPPQPQKNRANNQLPSTISRLMSLLYGLIGGVIAIIVVSGLQYAGKIPAPTSKQTLDKLQSMEVKLSALGQELKESAPLQAPNADLQRLIALETISENLTQRISALEQFSGGSNRPSASILENGSQPQQQAAEQPEPSIPNQQMINQGSGNHPASASSETVKQDVSKALAELSKYSDTVGAARNDATKALDLAQKNQNELNALEQRLSELNHVKQLDAKNLVRLMAANSLKAAIDRGGSYNTELALYKSTAPNNQSLQLLEQYASTGLENNAELSQDFASIADDIAKFDTKLDQNAGFFAKLWARAKNLVTTRPVGNVEGNEPSAIAARMEQAIREGDYQKALNEWQSLPDGAKNFSRKFVAILQARRDADHLLSLIIAETLQSHQPVEK